MHVHQILGFHSTTGTTFVFSISLFSRRMISVSLLLPSGQRRQNKERISGCIGPLHPAQEVQVDNERYYNLTSPQAHQT